MSCDRFLHPVEVGHLVEHAVHAAFGARAVVADDVEDQRVVELAHVADGVDEPADLGVRVLAEAREHLHLAGEELLLVRGQLVPVLDRFRLRRELRPRRHHAQLDLAREGLFPQLVPPLVELPLVLGDPLLRHLVRRVGRARREVDEERLVRREGLHRLHPPDRLVGHVGHEVVVRVLGRLDLGHAVIDGRRPLVRLAAHEAVELVEAGAGRPAVGRAGRADLPGGGFVVLPEGGGRVAVVPQHLRQRGHALGTLPGVSREGRRGLRDRAHVVHVMVAAGEQRGPRGRAKRRGVEIVVPQPLPCQSIHGRHVDGSAERAGLAEPHVVDEDDEHVRGAGRRLDLESWGRRCVPRIQHGAVRVSGFRDRQHRPFRRRNDACGGRCVLSDDGRYRHR